MMTSKLPLLPRNKALLALADCVVVVGALLAAATLRLGWNAGLRHVHDRSLGALVVVLTFPLVLYVFGLYDTRRLRSPASAVIPAAGSIAVALTLAGAYWYTTASLPVGRGIALEFAMAVFAGTMVLRLAYPRACGILSSRCLILGSHAEAARVRALVRQHPHAGLKVFGIVRCDSGDPRNRSGRELPAEWPVLGMLTDLPDLVAALRIDRLIVPAALREYPTLLSRLRPLRYRGVDVQDVVSLYEELAREIPLDQIDDEWLFRAATMSSKIHIRRLKRVTDVIATLVLLVPAMIVLPLAAAAIKLTSRGPLLFRQERVGLGSKPFMVLKLRTMYEDAEKLTGPVWSTDNDPRITPVGGALRKFRIDELPQLFNVLRGEMSLVGPRPERPVFVKKLAATVPFYSERLLVRPGITGWAQVMAPYAATVGDSMRKLQFDLFYTKHLSFSLDILILLKTAKTVLLGRERVQGGITAGEQLATTPVPLLLDGPHLVPPLGSVEAVAEGIAYSGNTTSDRGVNAIQEAGR